MGNDLTTEEKSNRQAQIRRSQLDMFSLQADKTRLDRKLAGLREEIRKMKINLGHLKVELEEKTKAEAALAREIYALDEELARAKKQINTLGR